MFANLLSKFVKVASVVLPVKQATAELTNNFNNMTHIVNIDPHACMCVVIELAQHFKSGQVTFGNLSPSACDKCRTLCMDKDQARDEQQRRVAEEEGRRRLEASLAQQGGDVLVPGFSFDFTKVSSEVRATFIPAGQDALVGLNSITLIKAAAPITFKTPTLKTPALSLSSSVSSISSFGSDRLLTPPPAAQLRAARPRPIYIPSPSSASPFSLPTNLIVSPSSSFGSGFLTPDADEERVIVLTGQKIRKGFF